MSDSAVNDAFVPVIGPGVKLSIALYHFVSPLGSAGEDMRDLGAEVTLFCAIMRQVRVIFDKPKSFRISTTAIQDVHEVLARGEVIFGRIKALLSALQDDSTVDVFTRVKETFRKTKVLMWKESLRSCTAMVQVMLTTMSFAERIATTGRSTPSSQVDDEELRDLMQSLILAQQSTNTRLAKLEDQVLSEEVHDVTSSVTQYPSFLEVDAHDTRRSPRTDHRRNRSSRAIFDLQADGVADLIGGSTQRLSVLLDSRILQQADSPEGQRNTVIGLNGDRLSVTQTNELLQTWTDQFDPAPPYMLSWHGDYASHFYSSNASIQLEDDRNRAETNLNGESSRMSEPDPALLQQRTLHQDVLVRGTKLVEGTFNAEEIDGQVTDGPRDILTAPSSTLEPGEITAPTSVPQGDGERTPPPVTILSNPTVPADPYITVIYEDMMAVVNVGSCKGPVDILEKIVRTIAYPAPHGFNVYELWSLDDDADPTKPQVVTEVDLLDMRSTPRDPGKVLILRMTGTGPPDGFQLNQAARGPRELLPDTANQPAEAGVVKSTIISKASSPAATFTASTVANDGVEILKSFRVSMDDPCWKVLPAALKKYKIEADWREYALYIVYGDNMRCFELEEKPLAIFKDLDRQGVKPMFMLRKKIQASSMRLPIHPPI